MRLAERGAAARTQDIAVEAATISGMVRPEMTFPVHCTACGCPLTSADAGPCPQCGRTAKTDSMAGSAHGQSSARGVMEAVVVATVTELREAIRDQKHEIIWRLPNL